MTGKPDFSKHMVNLASRSLGAKIQEDTGKDPRRTEPRGHQAFCTQAIEGKRIIIGREESRPVFVAEIVQINDKMARLTNVFIPPAFRTRKRLIGGALYKTKFAPPVRDKELIYFAPSPQMVEAAQLAGYQEHRVYRSITTLG